MSSTGENPYTRVWRVHRHYRLRDDGAGIDLRGHPMGGAAANVLPALWLRWFCDTTGPGGEELMLTRIAGESKLCTMESSFIHSRGRDSRRTLWIGVGARCTTPNGDQEDRPSHDERDLRNM